MGLGNFELVFIHSRGGGGRDEPMAWKTKLKGGPVKVREKNKCIALNKETCQATETSRDHC